jgi:hypothetical protein
MRRASRAVACIGIAAIAFAAMVPGLALLDQALFEPVWVLLLDETPLAFDPPAIRGDEQPVPLLSLLRSRAPPALLDA